MVQPLTATIDTTPTKFPTITDIPFNIWMLIPDDRMITGLGRVTSLDTMDSSGVNFHDEGLFSIPIFGRIGSDDRDQRFGYIDLKTTIFHPELYLNLIKLKSLYGGICSGKQYAVWDSEIQDFVVANELIGSTGFSFFMQHYYNIDFKRNASDQRDLRIEFVNKYRHAVFNKHLVSPAGFRDVQVNEKGQITEDEINDVYRKLITVSNTLTVVDDDFNSPTLDIPRWTMQYNAVLIYQMIKKIISGKKGWIQGKYGSRKTRNGTRNVITAMDTSVALLGAPAALKLTDTEIGFTQTLRGALPFTIHCLGKGILGQTFIPDQTEVWLTNAKTLQSELVTLPTDMIDAYTTRAGLEKLINRFFIRSLRNRTIVIGNHYLGLIYVDNTSFRVFKDIRDLPSNLNKKLVKPLTLADLLFTSCYQSFKELVGFITRYPITGAGSTYPTTYRVRTTVGSTFKIPLDENWQPMPENYAAHNFPNRDPQAAWLESVSVGSTRLARLDADFDGDMVSTPILYTQNAIDEVNNYFTKRVAFVDADGSFLTSAAIHTVNLVVANLTGDVPA